ncbi:LLM class flavin-dependent oxidoreductase [Intrasporangium sp. DVR]
MSALVLQSQTWPSAADTWRAIESSGVETAYVADHLTHPRLTGAWLADPWTTLAAAAGVTTRLRLGTLVASAVFRTPATLARMAATVQDISGGRFVLGLGAGVALDGIADRGQPTEQAERHARFVDVVKGLRAVWAGERSHEGQVLSFGELDLLPQAPGRDAPPLVLAGHGPQGLALVADEGDGWSTYGGPAVVGLGRSEFWALLHRQAQALTTACERAGRDPATLERSVLVGYAAYRPVESVASFLDEAASAEAAGFDEICLYWPTEVAGAALATELAVVLEAVAQVAARP